jgi:hypothetical protein
MKHHKSRQKYLYTALSCLVVLSISTPNATDPSLRFRVTPVGSSRLHHPVMLSRSEASRRPARQTLRCGSGCHCEASSVDTYWRAFMVAHVWCLLLVHLVHSKEQGHAPIPAGDHEGPPYRSAGCAGLCPGKRLCPPHPFSPRL